MTHSAQLGHRGAAPSWWRRRSLRARLTAAATVVIAVGMAAAAGLLVWRVHTALSASLDTTLTRQIRIVADDLAAEDSPPKLLRSAGESTVLQVIDAHGTVVTSSGDIDGEPRLFFLLPAATDPVIGTVTVAALDDAPYRVAAVSVRSPTGPLTAYVAAPTASLANSTSQLGTALIFGVPAMVALLGLVAWWLLGRALQPVETMRRQAATIPATDLHRRLDVPTSHDELGRLSHTFNDLLARIQAAADRQRRFVADAAHELRSPLTALRARLEIDQRHPGDTLNADNNASTLAQITRLTDLVNDLLQLARLDADPHLTRRPVDLDDLLWEAAREARQHPSSPRIDTTGISPARVLGDAPALRRVVRNLLDNARRHAHHLITIQLRIDPATTPTAAHPETATPTATLTIADDGPGIPDTDRPRVFERFVRLDAARSRDAGGAGLGLAIVADIVTAHHGQVWIDDNHPGTRFHVRLPALLPGPDTIPP